MLYNAKNDTVTISSGEMDYISFGEGKRVLILIPGLGDGLRTVKGTAAPMAAMYREFTKDFTVYAFSRITELPAGHTTRDMARDLHEAMDVLGIEKADILGVSMGGMIAQHLAADYPEKVNKLILTVTAPSPNPVLRESIGEWLDLAKQGDHAVFMDSNLRKIYSQSYYQKNKWMIPAVAKLTKPKSYERFFIQSDACLTHDTTDRLGAIKAPTLVVGGEKDLALGGQASRNLAAGIADAKLHMYEAWGHGLYEEEKGFNRLVMEFLMK